MNLLHLACWLVASAGAVATAIFVIDALREDQPRAAVVSAVAGGGIVAVVVAAGAVATGPWPPLLVLTVCAATAGALLIPRGRVEEVRIVGDQRRVDERDALFHRFYRLRPGTEDFERYYADHPDRREPDERVRALPDIVSASSRGFHPLTTPMTASVKEINELLAAGATDRAPALSREPVHASPAELTRRIKGFARYLGADMVGCAALNPAYVYSHVGRGGGTWGAPITLDHPGAIAIAVRMREDMLRHAPRPIATTETTTRYLETTVIARALAGAIRHMGYDARAHVDGDYRVMCVPVAADAGLGELGRLGLLITPRWGPRVRLSVVTTDMPLVHDRPVRFGVQDFCSACRKCAASCPSHSIDTGDKRPVNGSLRWISDQDGCYRAWRTMGSDCGLCVKVCPYAHPRSLSHDLVRWVIARNPLSRRLALWADDLAYGRRPQRRHALPPWHDDRA